MYEKVAVEDAPGYEDFEGELLMEVMAVSGQLMSVVGCVCEGKKETFVIPSEYIRGV